MFARRTVGRRRPPTGVLRIVAGELGGRRITAPRGRDTRPTREAVREAWFSALGPGIVGARVLDLFAGSGALGLELLSRGAAHVTFVERSAGALRTLRENLQALAVGDDEARIVREDALRYVAALDADAFDVAVADPPYDEGLADALARAFQRRPFARELWIEHRVSEPLDAVAGAHTRRYGDTLLTFFTAEP